MDEQKLPEALDLSQDELQCLISLLDAQSLLGIQPSLRIGAASWGPREGRHAKQAPFLFHKRGYFLWRGSLLRQADPFRAKGLP
jgi:hypothetical protein